MSISNVIIGNNIFGMFIWQQYVAQVISNILYCIDHYSYLYILPVFPIYNPVIISAISQENVTRCEIEASWSRLKHDVVTKLLVKYLENISDF